jgi:hypothetical protein
VAPKEVGEPHGLGEPKASIWKARLAPGRRPSAWNWPPASGHCGRKAGLCLWPRGARVVRPRLPRAPSRKRNLDAELEASVCRQSKAPPRNQVRRGVTARAVTPVFVGRLRGGCVLLHRPPRGHRAARLNESELADPGQDHSGRVRARDLVDYSCRGEPSRRLRAQADTVRPICKGDAAECGKVKRRGHRGRCIGPLKAKTRVRIPLKPPPAPPLGRLTPPRLCSRPDGLRRWFGCTFTS